MSDQELRELTRLLMKLKTASGHLLADEKPAVDIVLETCSSLSHYPAS